MPNPTPPRNLSGDQPDRKSAAARAPSPKDDYQRGLRLIRSDGKEPGPIDLKGAREAFASAAAAGHARAAYQLALLLGRRLRVQGLYPEDAQVPEDQAGAREALERAAAAGHAKAAHDLGFTCLAQDPPDLDGMWKAFDIMAKSRRLTTDAAIQLTLRDPPRWEDALRLFERSAAMGDSFAAEWAGLICAWHLRVPRPQEALRQLCRASPDLPGVGLDIGTLITLYWPASELPKAREVLEACCESPAYADDANYLLAIICSLWWQPADWDAATAAYRATDPNRVLTHTCWLGEQLVNGWALLPALADERAARIPDLWVRADAGDAVALHALGKLQSLSKDDVERGHGVDDLREAASAGHPAAEAWIARIETS